MSAMINPASPPSPGSPVTMTLSSGAFLDQGVIPTRHTCDGADRSPALSWTPPPEGTKSLALICDDPDAPRGDWVHWVIYDIPPGAASLAEGLAADRDLPSGARQGVNDFGRIGYGGPCPPRGPAHHYHFKLYALDTKLALPAGATKAQTEAALKGHVLGQGRLVGRYGR